jgi:hypothetical protein
MQASPHISARILRKMDLLKWDGQSSLYCECELMGWHPGAKQIMHRGTAAEDYSANASEAKR